MRATSDTESAFVAVAGERFVGLVGGYEPEDDEGCVHLVQMWTAPESRRKGVGRMFVDAILDWAGDRPVRLAVMRGNESARSGGVSAHHPGSHTPPE
jgi:GNAT superfamily N-acetyltransferase